MADHNDDHVYDDTTGEWRPASERAAIKACAGSIEVRDAAGTMLADGASVVLVKPRGQGGAGQTLKRAR
ncbi:alkylphosphonate transporter [Aminobacter anthyllidis]|uniref:Alkylphosphonate transporter n=1 Tax=Aminobacter anthyllidis TaxID=1035067 RepID=A0A9X1D7R2_9HYPH|nr:alkylphosphonate transporter [Aminobacter anthyllidis]MBT1159527.1 alkylphosphonate transporter [Aminobacter anthyllidis]